MSKLTLKQANTLVEKALEKARTMKIKPIAVVVLDDAGHVKAVQREDGASMFRFDVALGKAWASVAMGVSSARFSSAPRIIPISSSTLAATAQGKFLPQTGGVLIKNEKRRDPRRGGGERRNGRRRRGSLRCGDRGCGDDRGRRGLSWK